MLTLSEEAKIIDYGEDNFREGSYVHKKNTIYYYSWTDWKDKVNQSHYAMRNNPYGPFKYKGSVSAKPLGVQDNHSIIKFKNQWYYFYHIGNFTNNNGEHGNGNRRNVCVDSIFLQCRWHNANG